jgi:hypothetical protein
MKHGITKITAQIICGFRMMIVLHAGTRSKGVIDGCDLVFLVKSKDGDYHQEMNSVVFLEWFEKQLMPALKNLSLVVLDNASYHNVKTEDTVCPNFSQKKVVLQNYLNTTQHSFFCYCLFPCALLRRWEQFSVNIYSGLFF